VMNDLPTAALERAVERLRSEGLPVDAAPGDLSDSATAAAVAQRAL